MLLTPQQLQEKRQNHTLRLAFVGMSNVGKSFRASELAKFDDFLNISVDDLIGVAMELNDMSELSDWMGYPYEKGFEDREQEYLRHEERITTDVDLNMNKNIVLDTTGSFIYLPKQAQDFVRNNFLVVNLELPEALKEKMIENFFEHPKPIVWGESFDLREGEAPKDALRRCYPTLLRWRTDKYKKIADVSINGFEDNHWVGYKEFWKRLREAL